MVMITCKDVSFAYEGNVVVSGLDFVVNSGDYLCIIGENGSGKSTLMKGLLRLKQPKEGIISMNDGLKTNEIGYLPQQTAAQKDFPASVYEVVLSGRLSSRGIKPFYTNSDKRMVNENLEKLGITDLRDKCYRELSGGQQQRVLLCRALCATKKVLFLDEPVAGLDPVVTEELYRLIKKINLETGITIIMISHDIHSAMKYASHILYLKKKQTFFGSTAEYINSDIGRGFLGGERA